jgi:hypothetical protein
MTPVTLDTAAMEPAEAATLEGLVRAARIGELPPQVGTPAPGAADYRTITISIDAPGGAHTVRIIEPVADPALQSLVDHLERRRRAPRNA